VRERIGGLQPPSSRPRSRRLQTADPWAGNRRCALPRTGLAVACLRLSALHRPHGAAAPVRQTSAVGVSIPIWTAAKMSRVCC
jgi:hypothetical protein